MKNNNIVIEMEPDESGTFQPKKIIDQKPKRKLKQKQKQNQEVEPPTIIKQFAQGIDIGLDIIERLRRL